MLSFRFRALAIVAVALLVLAAATNAGAETTGKQIGDQVYRELLNKGELLRSSPLYDILDPIAARIKRAADPLSDYPLRFMLVRDETPNAFAAPGGIVYLTDALLYAVGTREELAAVMCHETAHEVNHDAYDAIRNHAKFGAAASFLGMIFGRGGIGDVTFGSNVQTLHFPRRVERRADSDGADICAHAGENPWAAVWLLRTLAKSSAGEDMEMFSDGGRDASRIPDLENHLKSNSTLFGRFRDDRKRGRLLRLPAEQSAPRPGAPAPARSAVTSRSGSPGNGPQPPPP